MLHLLLSYTYDPFNPIDEFVLPTIILLVSYSLSYTCVLFDKSQQHNTRYYVKHMIFELKEIIPLPKKEIKINTAHSSLKDVLQTVLAMGTCTSVTDHMLATPRYKECGGERSSS